MKCDSQEAFARGTIDDTIDEKQLNFNRPPSCSAAKKQTKDVHLSRSLLAAAFSSLLCLYLSLQTNERTLTDIANERA